MGVNRYNSEGYPDPTTYEALSNIEQQTKAARAYRPMVYVCSPFFIQRILRFYILISFLFCNRPHSYKMSGGKKGCTVKIVF